MEIKAKEMKSKATAKVKSDKAVDIEGITKSAQSLTNFLAQKQLIKGSVEVKGVRSKEGKTYTNSFGLFQDKKLFGTYRAMGGKAKRFGTSEGLTYFDI